MLILTLFPSTPGAHDALPPLRGTICRTRLAAGLADYLCELQDEHGVRLAMVPLLDYPRFAEPVALFAARAIDRVIAQCAVLNAAAPVFRASLEIHLNRTFLHRVEWMRENGALHVGKAAVRTPAEAPLWRIAQWALCAEQTGGIEMPPMPAAVRPAVYMHEGVPYCRLRDVPEEARQAYRKRHALSTCPLVPDCPDACYPWDLHGFLGC